MILHGDCLDVMAAMDPESVDAIVTDPPYGLGFMGKHWDHGVPNVDFWRAMLRVARPSAYLLTFGGTRTVHRIATNAEDAGWIIRDMLVWGYASGFPKSKASLKPAWEPIVMARKPGPLRMLAIDECRIPTDGEAVQPFGTPTDSRGGILNLTDSARDPERVRLAMEKVEALGRWPANIVLTDPIFDGGIEGVVGGGEATTGGSILGDKEYADIGYHGNLVNRSRFDSYGDTGTYSRFFTIPEGGTMCEWCGASPAEASSRQRSGPGVSVADPAPTEASSDGITPTASPTTSVTEQTSWHDESASTSRNGASPVSRLVVPSRSARAKSATQPRTSSGITMITESRWMCDSCADAATRFSMAEQESAERNYPWAYLIPKAARSDREPVLGGHGLTEDIVDIAGLNKPEQRAARGVTSDYKARANVHPTVKPTDLMRHLVRLVTPAGGVVLDPFLGSGTTALAAEMEGFEWIGIEREAEYVAIAEARLNGTQRGLGI